MEDFFQFLIFAAFAAIGVLLQKKTEKKKASGPSPQEVLEDLFPELNQETEIPMTEPTVLQQPARKKKKTAKKERFQPIEQPSIPTEQPVTPQQTNNKIRLSSKEEARRAFIHSEIFNRKYQ